jgi:uncharacterized protein (TIGR02679 family)
VSGPDVRAVLGGPDLRALFEAVRDAVEARGPEEARTVTVAGLSTSERRAIANLHGWNEIPAGEKVRISLPKLDKALRDSALGLGLLEALELLFGRLVNRRSARAEAHAERETLWSRAREHPVVKGRPELQRWLDELRAHGLLTRAARATGGREGELLERALATAARLPAPGLLLPVLATEVFGDAHALDPGRAEAALVLRAAALIAGWSSVPSSAPERRKLWAEVGVACDPLSTDVLTLGLKPVGVDLLSRHLRECSEAGEPRRVTLRELMRHPVAVPAGTMVFVCENPSVLASAADGLGERCAPLICVEGVPSTAALLLLRGLGTSGAKIRVHADFDWAGVKIVNLLLAQVEGARAWRMEATDYESAAARAGYSLELSGAPVAASWDPLLAKALETHGVAIAEESCLAMMLEELERGHSG